MKAAVSWMKFFTAILVIIAVGEVPWVREFAKWIDVARPWLLPLTIGSAIVGLLALACGLALAAGGTGRSMSDSELGRLAARTQILGPGAAFSRAWFKGWRRGRQVEPPLEWSLGEMKTAWRDGS